MNWLERSVSVVSPGWAHKRMLNRLRVQALAGAYEAVETGRLRRRARDFGSGNTAMAGSGRNLRNFARHLDRNHDLSSGILDVLVRYVVGPHGIGVEPQPLNPDGSINHTLATQLADLHREWAKTPEVTGEYNWARSEQLLCRSWLRDGDVFWQYVEGAVKYFTHGSRIPLSLELLESDFVPLDLDNPAINLIQGVECDTWGKPQAYHVYLTHPGEVFAGWSMQMKRVTADRMGQLKFTKRIGQRRGESLFATVLTRLDDVKDYEESERVAAKVAASMAAYIKKGSPEDYGQANSVNGEPTAPPERHMSFQAGMIFDDLRPGEDVGTIDTNRPNADAVTWRAGQLRAIASGTHTNFSSIARTYEGSYSSQRQELVEGWAGYAVLSMHFVGACSAKVYARFVSACVLAGLIKVPRGMTFEQLSHALYNAPQMPWIDPYKEAQAFDMLESRSYISGGEVVRKMGRNPRDTLRAEKSWQDQLRKNGIVNKTTSPLAADGTTPPKPKDNTHA